MTDGDELRTVEDLDAEIESLRAERARLELLRADPQQRSAREAVRTGAMGRWLREGHLIKDEWLPSIRACAKDTAAGWVFDVEWLEADGWRRDGDGWKAPG